MKKFIIILIKCGSLEKMDFDYIVAKDVYEAKRKYEQEYQIPKGQFVTAQPF